MRTHAPAAAAPVPAVLVPPAPGRRRGPLEGRRAGRLPVVDAAAAVGLLLFLTLSAVPSLHAVAALVYAVVVVGGVVTMIGRTARRGPGRTPWSLLSAAAAVLVTCQLALLAAGTGPVGTTVELAVFRDHPWSALSGLAAYPLLAGGQLALMAQRVRDTVATGWLDTALAATGLAVLGCAFLLPPLRRDLDLPAAGAVALVGRPLLDVLLLSLAVSGCAYAGRRTDWRMPLLAACCALLLVTDTTGVLALAGVLPAAGWLAPVVAAGRLGAMLLLVAAARRDDREATGPRRQSGWANLLGPAGVLVIVVVVLVADHHQRVGPGAVYLALGAVLGVGLKIALVFREVLALADSRRQATTDDLTGCANRRGLSAALTSALAPPPSGAARRLTGAPAGDDLPVGLLLIGLDRFKAVNDLHGRAVGDALLCATAARLREVAPPRSVVARLGGDEFALVLPSTTTAGALEVATAVTSALGEPHDVLGRRLRVGASIGVTSTDDEGGHRTRPTHPGGPADGGLVGDGAGGVGGAGGAGGAGSAVGGSTGGAAGVTAGRDGAEDDVAVRCEELLRRADAALHHAKDTGRGAVAHDAALGAAAEAEAGLVEDLRAALLSPAAAQVAVHYQPQVVAGTGRVAGVEALVRWEHPRFGLLPPDSFLPLVEREGLMGPLTAVVLHTAAAQAAAWRSAGHPLRLAVNLSASCLADPGLLRLVDEVLAASGTDPRDLVLEITETTLMTDPQLALATARDIAARGVGLSIDDYGTGYSSLAYLHDIPATELKLDRSFTARLLDEERTASIVITTVDLAHRLGMRLLVEGVEDAATLAALTALGCDETQGYLHSRPVPAAQLTAWLAERARTTGSGTTGGEPRGCSATGTRTTDAGPDARPGDAIDAPTAALGS